MVWAAGMVNARSDPQSSSHCAAVQGTLGARMEGEQLMAVTAIQDVREVLGAYPGLADVAVLTHVQEPAGQVLVAYAVLNSPGFDLAALHKYVRAMLPGSAVPAAII